MKDVHSIHVWQLSYANVRGITTKHGKSRNISLATVPVVNGNGAGINGGQTVDKRWTNDGQTMDNPWINAASREFTVSSIGCAYRAELILGR